MTTRRTLILIVSAAVAAGILGLTVVLFIVRALYSSPTFAPTPPARQAETRPSAPPTPSEEPGTTCVYRSDFTAAPGAEWSHPKIGKTPKDQRPYLGRFVEQPVTLNLTTLPPHKLLRITFDLYLMGSWDGSSKAFGEKIWDLNLLDGRSLLHTTFGNCGFFTDNNEQSFPDSYPCRPHPAWTGSVEHGTLGTTQSWGGPSRTWDVSSVYHFVLAFPHSEPEATFEFKATMRGGKDKGYGLANVQVDILPEWVSRSEPELADLWKTLGDADTDRCFKAQWDLIATGDAAVDYITKHLDETIDLPKPKLDDLIKELASADDEQAKQVRASLVGQGRTAQASIVSALDDDAFPAPAKPKLTSIQRTITTYPETATELRLHRARQLLLAIHTPAAQALAARISPDHPEPDRAVADLVAAGHAAGVLGDWKKAFECFRDAVDAGSAREGDWSCAAVTALAIGDTNASLRLCRGIMNRFAKKDDASAAERCAKHCVALPAIPGDLLAKAVERADFSVAAGPDSRWRQMAKGMAEYRRGNWSNATRWLREPERSANLEVSPLAWLFGAMTRHQLGDTASARQALDEANRRLKVIVESGELARSRYNTWDNYARAFAVRAEAERLILGREASPPLDPAAVVEGRNRWQPILQLLRSGDELAARKQWEEASEAFAQALEQPGFTWNLWELKQAIPSQWLPVAALLAANETRHLKLCRAMLDRTNATLAPVVLEGYASVCLARPLPSDLRDRASALAERAIRNPEPDRIPATSLLRGMKAYREGQYQETLSSLERAEIVPAPTIKTRALAFRGMACFRLGRVEEARRALQDAEQAAATGLVGETGWGGPGLCQVALDELRGLLVPPNVPEPAQR
jgi:tetratricopeptide (TPR) repeat protein